MNRNVGDDHVGGDHVGDDVESRTKADSQNATNGVDGQCPVDCCGTNKPAANEARKGDGKKEEDQICEDVTLINANGSAGEGDDTSDDEVEGEEDLYGVQNEAIPATIFSMMFVSPACSRAYCYAAALCGIQIIITIAALNDSFIADSSNPAKIPPGVPTAVSVAQAIVIPIAVAAQPNFIEGIIRLNDRVNEHIELKPMSGSFLNWLVSSVAQMLVGLGLLILVFVFTMQSETVLQVLVNIVALFAVSNISTIGFMMANRGFLGYKVWKETINVTNHTIDRSYKCNKIHQVGYALCVCIMLAAYGVIVQRQRSGFYRCSSIYVQYDDSIEINLPYLSGVYVRDDDGKRLFGRFTYYDEVTMSTLFLGYCKSEQSWGIGEVNGNFDQCSIVLSSETTTFDASTTGELPWRVRSSNDDSLVPLPQSVVQCADCSPSSCFPHRGTCIDNKCVCKDRRYGVHCEFRAPCEEIVVNENRADFPPIQSLINRDYVLLPRRFLLLKDDNGTIAEAYNRPVYHSERFAFLMLFTGRRWAIISPTFEDALEGDEFELQQMRNYLLSVFQQEHMFTYLNQPNIQRFTVSEVVDTDSPVDQGLPIGLHWIGTRIVRSSSMPTIALDPTVVFDPVFVCAQCDNSVNKCENFGICDNSTGTGVCRCAKDDILGIPLHSGALCERPLTCTDARTLFPDILPSGCVSPEYECGDDGRCSCTNLRADAGRFCQFLPCNHEYNLERFPPFGCANDGRCSNLTGDCTCDDPDRFEGKYCQRETPNCFDDLAQELNPPNGCNGRGVCDGDTGFCACDSTSFEGRFCQIEREPCYSDVLQDRFPGGCDQNGTCNIDTGSCECTLPVFGGHYCEQSRFECFHPIVLDIWPSGCDNGGFCNSTGSCSCPAPFTGRYCHRILANQTIE